MFSNQSDNRLAPLRNAWLTVALLFGVGCLNYLDRTMIATMRESIVEKMPMTNAQFALLTSVFLWVYGILSPFAGFLADRFNRSKVIILSLFVWSAVTWLTSMATNFEELLATRALMGISEACYIPAALALIADYHPGATRSRATGIHMAGIISGQSLGFVAGWLAETYTWSTAFVCFGIIGIIYSLVLVFFLKNPDSSIQPVIKERLNFYEGMKSLFSTKAFLRLLFLWSLVGIVAWMVVGWLPTYYKENFNLSQANAGLFSTAYLHPAAMLGVLFGGFWADRWSRRNNRARILVPAIGLLIAAPFIFMAASTQVLPLAILCFLIYGFTREFIAANMMPILCMVADNRYRATGYGVLNMFACFIGGIGLFVAGMLRDAKIDLSFMYQIAAVLLVVAGSLLLLVRTKFENAKSI